MSQHSDAGTSIWNGYGGEITMHNCECGLGFSEAIELQAHLLEENEHCVFSSAWGVFVCQCGRYCFSRAEYDKHLAAESEEVN